MRIEVEFFLARETGLAEEVAAVDSKLRGRTTEQFSLTGTNAGDERTEELGEEGADSESERKTSWCKLALEEALEELHKLAPLKGIPKETPES